jgi:ABC-type Co2+ transport system permease subunit
LTLILLSESSAIQALGISRMRILVSILATFFLVSVALCAQAKELSKSDRFVCGWGAGIAGGAQASKLSGVSLYGARRKLQYRSFQQSWMRMMAMGITEQTYNSASRLKPDGVAQTYNEECLKHELAQR